MPSENALNRREFHQQCGTVAGTLALGGVAHATAPTDADNAGVIRGEPTAEKVGVRVFESGGNAIDAAVAAAFAAAIAAPHQTGLGGYGGHLTLHSARHGKIISIDFNSAAPAAARPDMFPLDAAGKVIGQKNMYGWLAAGVPGVLAGLHLALTRYGTKPFHEIVQPAIDLAQDGFPLGVAAAPLRTAARQLAADAASRALYFKNGQPLAAGDHYANPGAARLLESLAAANSVEPFYRGKIAQQIAAAFGKNGGLVTADDLAAYQAREVEPLSVSWGEWQIHTAPLTSGGATMLQAMLLLYELKWEQQDRAAADTLQLQIEALRYAWQDRLQLFGDPQGEAPATDKVLESASIRVAATQIEAAVKSKRPLSVRTTSRPDQGTISLSAADRAGNLINITLTHGGAFGARVTLPEIGLTLGHGMSRFDPHSEHPNAPGPRKRPLHNMCPTIVSHRGRPLYAIGGRGGRKIPNAVCEVLLQLVARGKSLTDAVAAPRMHTEGQLSAAFERSWPADAVAALKDRGYTVSTAASATVSAAGLLESGELVAAMR